MTAFGLSSVHIRFISATDDMLVMSLSGELDLQGAGHVEGALRAARRRGSRLVLDLSGLTFCDCSGISVFIRTARHFADRDGWFRLAGPQGIVAELFALMRLGEAVAVYSDAAAATVDEHSVLRLSEVGARDVLSGSVV
jgi:anti-sigma B factor antagonist